MYSLFVKDNIS